MTKAYIEGFSKTAEAYGINPRELLKIAVGLPDGIASQYGYKQDTLNNVGPLLVGAGASALGTLAAAGAGPIAASAAPAGVAFGAGSAIGTMARNLADIISEGAVTRKLETAGDKAGRLTAAALQKLNARKQSNSRPMMAFNKYLGRYQQIPFSKR